MKKIWKATLIAGGLSAALASWIGKLGIEGILTFLMTAGKGFLGGAIITFIAVVIAYGYK